MLDLAKIADLAHASSCTLVPYVPLFPIGSSPGVAPRRCILWL